MRALVLLLALLAGLKIWASDQMFRAAAQDALVAAYRDKAITACQTIAMQIEPAVKATPVKAGLREMKADGFAASAAAQVWAKPQDIRLIIGKRGVDVNFWDRDNALWKVRYTYPFLVLTPSQGTLRATCEYDVTLGQAAITRL